MAKTMNHWLTFLAYVTIIISVVSMSMSIGTTVETNYTNSPTGFTVDLIHVDSPQSPFYDSTLSPSQRLENDFRRSLVRIHHFKTGIDSQYPPQTDITLSNGGYLMKYSIGTPPTPALGFADTGSDAIWTQCQPCVRCFKQSLPIFNPQSSSTYSKVVCKSNTCRFFRRSNCDKSGIYCLFEESYVDGSYTRGMVSRETITLPASNGRSWSFPYIRFGCGLDNGGSISRVGGSGIVGIGGGVTSLISQLDYVIGGKFSYCLLSHYMGTSNTSKMNFGANAVVSGAGTVTTPIANRLPSTFYYLILEGVSIDGERLEFYDPAANLSNNYSRVDDHEGNIIIDSGTTFTFLPQEFYDRIKERVNRLIYYRHVSHRIFDLCYFSRQNIFIFPGIIFHFRGADVRLKAENIFARVSDTTICLVFLPAKLHGVAIYGNLAQLDFLVGFDLKKRTVSFKPKYCARS